MKARFDSNFKICMNKNCKHSGHFVWEIDKRKKTKANKNNKKGDA